MKLQSKRWVSILLAVLMITSSASICLISASAKRENHIGIAASETDGTHATTVSTFEESYTDDSTEYNGVTYTSEPTTGLYDGETFSGGFGDDLTWTIERETGTLTISGYGHMQSYSSNGDFPWYASRSRIKSVVLENGVTSIAGMAFFGYENLSNVTISDTVTEIGSFAFEDCKKLTSIVIPDGVKNIGFGAFLGCSNLKSILISDNVISIGGRAFEGTTLSQDESNCIGGLWYIGHHLIAANPDIVSEQCTIATGTRCIADGAFAGCFELKEIDIPDGVTSIGASAFNLCFSLEKISIPDSVTHIGNPALYDTAFYRDPTNWEDGVLYIDHCLVDAEHPIADYHIKPGTVCVANSAFSYCNTLETVSIPDSVASIGESVFEGCSRLSMVSVSEENPKYCSDSCGALYNKSKTVLFFYPRGNTRTEYVIFDGVKSINQSVFESCSYLVSIAIPNSVTSIGNGAFINCTKLENITLPESLSQIDSSAFYGCTSIARVTIPDGVKHINDSTFEGCTNLASITLSDSVTSIGNSAFLECASLVNLTIPNSVTIIGERAFYACTSLTDITIPDSVTTIDDEAFYGCTSLANVKIPDGLIYLGYSAFEGCITLSGKVTIPRSVKTIGNGAFSGCLSLTAISVDPNNSKYWSDENGVLYVYNSWYGYGERTSSLIQYPPGNAAKEFKIPEDICYIGLCAFSGSHYLESIYINKSVHYFNCIDHAFSEMGYVSTGGPRVPSPERGGYAKALFFGCNNLRAINVDEDNPYFSSDSFGVLFDKAKTQLIRCPINTTLTEYKIPKTVDSIEDGAFSYCRSLTKVSIPSGVKEISEATFYECDTLETVYLHNGVETFDEAAFLGCVSLESIHIPNTVSSISNYCFVDHYYMSLLRPTYICSDTTDCYAKRFADAHGIEFRLCTGNDSHGHTYSAVVTEPTCTAAGYTTYTCDVCGDSYTADEVSALGHDFGEWTVKTEPTVEAEGEETRTCARCGQTESRALPKRYQLRDDKSDISIDFGDGSYDDPNSLHLDIQTVNPDENKELVQRIRPDLRSNPVAAYTIRIADENGNTAQPKEGHTVTIRIPIPTGVLPESCVIVHVFSETGKTESFRMKNNTLQYENGFLIIQVSRFSPFVLFVEQDAPTTVTIRNNPGTATLRYGETLTLTADVENLPDGAKLVWTTDGDRVTLKPSADGKTCEVTSKKNGTVTVAVKLVDSNGNPIWLDGQEISDSEAINSKATFIYKLIWFFKRIFGVKIHITQEIIDP